MSFRQDYRRRRSFSYKFKRWFNVWFWEDHTKEIKTVVCGIGEMLLAIAWLSLIFVIPHLFH